MLECRSDPCEREKKEGRKKGEKEEGKRQGEWENLSNAVLRKFWQD